MPKLTSDTMLSCSQLPSLFGVSPYSTPNDVLTFCMKAMRGEDPRTQAGEAADWGNALEPAIIAEMAKRLGLKSYVMPDTAFTHPHLPLAASADAIGTPEENVVIQHDPSKGRGAHACWGQDCACGRGRGNCAHCAHWRHRFVDR